MATFNNKTKNKYPVEGSILCANDTDGTPIRISTGNLSYKFNVKDFGAEGDGVLDSTGKLVSGTDDTNAIQDAINHIVNIGSGTLFMPRGVYVVSGNLITSDGTRALNSQLYIPYTHATDLREITIEGETAPQTMVGFTNKLYGTIIFSTLITPSGTEPAILGSIKGDNSLYDIFSHVRLNLKNLTFKKKTFNASSQMTSLGAVNMRYINVFEIENIMCGVDELIDNITSPVGTGSFGIIFPRGWNNAALIGRGFISVSGFENGLIIQEHTIINDLVAFACTNGLVVDQQDHACTVLTYHCEICTNAVSFIGTKGFLNIVNFFTEHFPSSGGLGQTWMDRVYDVKFNSHSNVICNVGFYNIWTNDTRNYLLTDNNTKLTTGTNGNQRPQNGMKGTTATRPSNPNEGDEWYNLTDHKKEYYNGTTWVQL